MNVSCPALAFACALVVAASALQASVITPPVHTFPAKDDVPNVVVTPVAAITCESSAMPICAITEGTALRQRPTDLPPRNVLLEISGAELSGGEVSWLQFLPVVIEVSAHKADEITMFSGHFPY